MEEEILALVSKHPGIRPSQVIGSIDGEDTDIGRILGHLIDRGVISVNCKAELKVKHGRDNWS